MCKAVKTEEIRQHGYVLTPGRYVGAPPQAEDEEPFEQKMARLTAELHQQMADAQRLEKQIEQNLRELGF